jgi:hypothetical protein
MGVLYLAIEPGLDRRVALKLIAPEAAADKVFSRRFAEESRIAASIEHPNVVPIYAAGEEGGVPYIAMRYVSGLDLGRRLARERRLTPAAAVRLVTQIGEGLDAIHAAGLVHRDVKPANVLLSGEEGAEHAYITDFGVARNVATQSGLTQTGRFVGTLDYVAPEQISGATVDARADIYALGCLLFKLLTGDVPFPRDTEAARLYAHLNEPPPAPSLFVPEAPMALDDVAIRAMSKAPEDRYPSAGDLGRAAEAALSGAPVDVSERTVATGAAATRTAETLPVRRPRRRVPLALAGGLFVLAAILAIAIAMAGSGGDGGGRIDASGSTGPGEKVAEGAGAEPAPRPLGRDELIRRADAICTDSQGTFLATAQDFPEGETTPDLAYAKILTGISTRAVRRFRALAPPAGLRRDYERYVSAQERVKSYDRQALRAAEAGDAGAYLAARERRDREQAERHELARAVGLKTCSARSG